LLPKKAAYESPVLVVDPGMHTAIIMEVATDKAGQFIATGAEDKTVRVWSGLPTASCCKRSACRDQGVSAKFLQSR
jgi:hypothetical protein